MSWLAWIVVGLVAGLLTRLIMPGTKDEPTGWLGTTALGIIGAVVGGWIWKIFIGTPGANGINLGSILVALVGSIIVISVMRVSDRRTVDYR